MMDATSWSPLGVAAIALAGTLIQQRRQRPVLRDQIKADLEIWAALPEESNSRSGLLSNIDARVQRLMIHETEHRRDPSGMVIGVLMTVLFGWLAWWTWQAIGVVRLLEVPIIFFGCMGIYGFFESLRRVPRDERGIAESKPANDVSS